MKLIRSFRNQIHKSVVIGKNVSIGKGNYIGPYCVIGDNVTIGNNNIFESHVSIGSPAEHKDLFYNKLYYKQKGNVLIGDDNYIREFVTINKPIKDITMIGNGCYLMKSSHFGHDSKVFNKVIVSCGALIGGHTIIMDGAYLGLGSITHQFSIIGAYAMLGMACVVTKKSEIEPGNIYIGNPAKFLKINSVGLMRSKISIKDMEEYKIEFCNLKMAKGI